MSAKAASKPFGTARRRDIARACSFSPRTATDIARQLATETGSVTSVLRSMAEESILEIATVPHAEGRAYILASAWRGELITAVGSAAPPGLLMPGMRLLLVGARDAGAFAPALRVAATDPRVVWAVRLDGSARMLLAAEAEDPPDRDQVDRLEAIMANEGLDVVQLRVDRLLDIVELTSYTRQLERRPHPAIPAGE